LTRSEVVAEVAPYPSPQPEDEDRKSSVFTLNVIPFVDTQTGVIIFATASILKDSMNQIGDLIDDGIGVNWEGGPV
jgi:hypothetical protein